MLGTQVVARYRKLSYELYNLHFFTQLFEFVQGVPVDSIISPLFECVASFYTL